MRSKRTSAVRHLALILILISAPLALVGCSDQMAKMEANQLELEAMIAANARQIATVSSQIHNSQSTLDERLSKLDANTEAINTQVASIQDQQNRLQGALVSSERHLTSQLSQLEENQAQLRSGVAQVADISQKTNSAVSAVARDQATLHNVVQGHKRELDKRITAVAKSQEETHAGIAKLSQADSDLGDRIAAVSQKQDTLQRLATDNYNQLAGQVANNLKETQAGIADLQRSDKGLAGQITAVSQEQQALREMATDNHANLTSHIASVAQNQERTQAGIARLQQTDEKLTGQIAAVSTEQQSLRELTTTNQQQLTDQIAKVAGDQEALRELTASNQRQLTDQVAAVASDQQALRELTESNQQQLTDQIGTLASDQQSLRDLAASNQQQLTGQIAGVVRTQEQTQARIAQLQQADRDLAAQIATESETQQAYRQMAAGNQQQLSEKVATLSEAQSAQRQLATANHDALAGQLASVTAAQQKTQAGIADLKQADRDLDTKVAAVAQEQGALKELTTNNHANLTSHIASVAQNQERTQAGINQLQEADQNLARKVAKLSDGQLALQELTAGNHEAMGQKVTALSNGQTELRNDLGQLKSQTQTVAADLNAVTEEQAAIRQTLKTASTSLAEKLALVETNQDDIQSLIDRVANTAETTREDVTALAKTQATIQQTQKANNEALNNQLAVVTKSQQYATEHLDAITTTTVQLTLDVLSLEEAQNNVEQAVQNNHTAATSTMAALAEGQKDMQGRLGKVAVATEEVSRDVTNLGQKQNQLEQTFEGTRKEFATALDTITKDQKTMQGQLDKVVTTGELLNRQIDTLGNKQSKIEQVLQGTRTEFTDALASVNESQWAMQGDLDTVTAKTDEVATEVKTLGANQGKFERALAGAKSEFGTALGTVTENQQTMQGQLQQVATANEKVARDVATLDAGQSELAETVKANREELVTRLNEIAQGQQQWLTRFDATEAKVEAMTQSITSLEQRVTKLQGTLQTSLTDLNALLDARDQERGDFEDRVGQDVKSVNESVSQLADVQAGLVQDVQTIQVENQSRNEDILSALQKFQQQRNAEAKTADPFETAQAEPDEVILP